MITDFVTRKENIINEVSIENPVKKNMLPFKLPITMKKSLILKDRKAAKADSAAVFTGSCLKAEVIVRKIQIHILELDASRLGLTNTIATGIICQV